MPHPLQDTLPSEQPGARRVLMVGRIVGVAVSLLMAALLARVAQLQTSPPPELEPWVGEQYSHVELLGRRGSLLDRMGRELATSGIAHRLYADPKAIADPNTFPEFVGYALDYDPAALQKRLYKLRKKRYVVIDPNLTEEQWSKFERIMQTPPPRAGSATGNSAGSDAMSVQQTQIDRSRVQGLYTDVWIDRQYPQGATAGHVIGFMGAAGHGFEGAERMFDRQLLGTPGKLGYLRDAGRRPLAIDLDDYQHPADGKPVRLSIDISLQAIAEKELAEACRKFEAKTGEMVVMDPYTGEILAMALFPAFDPNEYRHVTAEQRRNRCVTDPFEPGSTFKPFIWAFAIEQKATWPDEMINTDQPLGRALRDTHEHGTISAAEVLIKSSNRGMAVLGQRMGSKNLHKAVKSFGFGEVTRSELPGESKGQVKPLREWNPLYSVTSVPMGQEVSVTPLQLCRAFCVFANGGYMVTPTLLAREPNDRLDVRNVPVVERILSPATAATTRQVMVRVMTEGTGRQAQSVHYTSFGKTGTAQVAAKPPAKGYEPGAYSSVFVAGAPADQPRLVVACVIHKPNAKKGYYGGLVAAPPVAVVIDKSLEYMGVKPDKEPAVKPGAKPADGRIAASAAPR